MTAHTIDEATIRETAYLFWLDAGQPDGCDQEHWLKAIDALSATPVKKKPARKAAAKPRAAKAKATPATKKPRAAKAAKTA